MGGQFWRTGCRSDGDLRAATSQHSVYRSYQAPLSREARVGRGVGGEGSPLARFVLPAPAQLFDGPSVRLPAGVAGGLERLRDVVRHRRCEGLVEYRREFAGSFARWPAMPGLFGLREYFEVQACRLGACLAWLAWLTAAQKRPEHRSEVRSEVADGGGLSPVNEPVGAAFSKPDEHGHQQGHNSEHH